MPSRRIALPLFVVLSIVHTWPMLPKAASHIMDEGDSMLNGWLMAAVSRALATHPLRFFDVNAYYPYREALTTLDHQLSAVVLAGPVYLATGNPHLALNLYTIATFVLSGLFCARLVAELTDSESAGLIAGSLFAFSAARLENINHAHVLGNYWLPLALLFTHRYVARPTWRRVAAATGAALMLALTAWYNAVLGPLAIAVVAAAGLMRHRATAPAAIGRLAVAGLAAGIVVAAVALPYARTVRNFQSPPRQASEPIGGEAGATALNHRTISSSTIQDNSTGVEGFAAAAAGTPAPWLAAVRGVGTPTGRFFPGVAGALLAGLALMLVIREQSRASRLAWPALALAAIFAVAVLSVTFGRQYGWPIHVTRLEWFFPALVGSFVLWIFLPLEVAPSRSWIRDARTYLVIGIVGGALALGISVYAWGTLVARGIYPADLPGFNLLRASVRFGVLYALGLSVLAGFGYAAVTRGVRPGLRPALAAAVLVVVNFELLCQPPPMRRLPRVPLAYQWLRTAPAGPVVEFPIHDNLSSLYWSLFHRQPMVDGYGLVEPAAYARLRDDDDLSPAMVEHIRSYFHARYVVVNRRKYLGDRNAALSANLALDAGTLTPVAAFDGREVFEIGGPSRGAPVLRAYRPWMLEKVRGVAVDAALDPAREATTQVLEIWGNGRLLTSASPEAVASGQRVFAPLPNDRADGLNIEILGDYRLTTPGGPLGTTGHPAPADIRIEATLRATRVQVNGHVWAGRQGYTMAVIAPDGRVEEVRTFNTSWYEAASHALANRIASIPAGWTAAVATNYDASRRLTADAVDALRTLGMVTDLRGRFRVMHAAVGIKGAAPGTASEAVSADAARCVIGAPRLIPVTVRDVRLY